MVKIEVGLKEPVLKVMTAYETEEKTFFSKQNYWIKSKLSEKDCRNFLKVLKKKHIITAELNSNLN